MLPSKADIVIPNPESGWGVAVGIAEGLGISLYPALIKLPQAVRTFQEGESLIRSREVGLKFGGIDSLLKAKNIAMGDDSIVRGSVSEGGSLWVVYNAGAKFLEFWISYGPMFFPSFKESEISLIFGTDRKIPASTSAAKGISFLKPLRPR